MPPATDTVVLASGNEHKLREIAQILSHFQVTLAPQGQYGVPEAAETGLSFVENALIKARQACRHTGLAAIADDSGIAVDALGGAPGIYSARYAERTGEVAAGSGRAAADRANNATLLRALAAVPDERRGARYHCVIVALRHAEDPVPLICCGSWEGRILRAERGEFGFGYDSLFHVPGHGCSAAELAPQVKNAISHRAAALEKLAACWPHRP